LLPLPFAVTIRRAAAFAAKLQLDGESIPTDEGESIDKQAPQLIPFHAIRSISERIPYRDERK
jgi:hypothetical protein